jgi:uncharacterized OsmC-like protein
MNVDELRALQAPFKDKYKQDAGAAVITLRAKGTLDEASIACKIETGHALVEAGLQACSGDMLLEALVACAGVTLRAVATALGIEVRSGTVSAEGDLDFRGTLGVSKEAPVGFKDIRLSFDLDTDADPERLATLQKLTERYCVVYQTLRQPPAIAVRFAAAQAPS